jgi:hypothetical protein
MRKPRDAETRLRTRSGDDSTHNHGIPPQRKKSCAHHSTEPDGREPELAPCLPTSRCIRRTDRQKVRLARSFILSEGNERRPAKVFRVRRGGAADEYIAHPYKLVVRLARDPQGIPRRHLHHGMALRVVLAKAQGGGRSQGGAAFAQRITSRRERGLIERAHRSASAPRWETYPSLSTHRSRPALEHIRIRRARKRLARE